MQAAQENFPCASMASILAILRYKNYFSIGPNGARNRRFAWSFTKSRSLHPGEAHGAHRTRFADRRAKMRREGKSRVPHGGIGMTMLIEAQE